MNKEKGRLLFVITFTFFLFSLLIVQYFKIQIVEKEKWTKAALNQHEFILKEPAQRGTFFANTSIKEGTPSKPLALAIDVTKFHLYIDPASIPEAKRFEVATTLMSLLNTQEERKPALFAEFEKKSRSRKIATWLDRETKEKITKWWFPYAKKEKIASNAIYFVTDYLRSYPFGKLLGQVLHTIREVKDEKSEEGIPTGGLESYFNDLLKGERGEKKLLRSPLNAIETDEVIVPCQRGADIYLTINPYIQAIAEEELEKGVKEAKAKGGWAVMIDPFTGEILALAQYPFFDPSQYKTFFNDPVLIEDTKVKPITDVFELGSIMKPITISIAQLANNELKKRGRPPIFDPNEKVNGLRAIFPGRANKPIKDHNTHHWLNMYMAIQKSSNVYMAELMDRVVHTLGPEWYRKQLTEVFGFGEKTGIELPGEAPGRVPEIGKKNPNGTLEWSLPTPYSLAMGYSLMASSLQMVRAYSIFVNGGKRIEPTLVRMIVRRHPDDNPEILLDHTKTIRREKFKKVLPDDIALETFKAMKYTTKWGGTARLADIPGYSEGGKTGTAEKIVGGAYSNKKHISSFIGFTPAREKGDIPVRFVLLVSIDEPEYRFLEGGVQAYMGGRCAAPVFQAIASRTLNYLGLPPDDPYGWPPQDPRYNAQKADWIPEVASLKNLYDSWNGKK